MKSDLIAAGRAGVVAVGGLLLAAPPVEAASVLFATAEATTAYPNGRILRIEYDAGTAVVSQTFNGPTSAIGDGFTGLAFRESDSTLFLTDGAGTGDFFVLNAFTGAQIRSFAEPETNVTYDGLAFGADGNLLAQRYDQRDIIEINPDTGAYVQHIVNVTGVTDEQGGLAADADRIYGRGDSNDTILKINYDGSLTAGDEGYATPSGVSVLGLARTADGLFAASGSTIYRLNPLTGAVLDSVSITGVSSFDGLAATGSLALIPEPLAAGAGALLSLVALRRRRSGMV